MAIIMHGGPLNGVLSPGATGARAIFEYRPSQTALCVHTHAENARAGKKVWKQMLPWPLGFYGDRSDRTGASERIYTHKTPGVKGSIIRLCTAPRLCAMQRLLREKSCAATKGRNVVRAAAKNGTSATGFSGPERRGSRPVAVDKNYPARLVRAADSRLRSPEIMSGLVVKSPA